MKSRFLTYSAALAFYMLSLPHATAIDTNQDGVSDVWTIWYGAQGLPSNGDMDGDGLSNAAEAVAGTNPFVATDAISVYQITKNGNELTLRWASKLDKRYRLQCSGTLMANDWTNIGLPMLGNDGEIITSTPADGAHAFFRVLVDSDPDSDGDGVTDWEERRLGTSLTHTHSGGIGQLGDRAAAEQRLLAGNVVSVTALDDSATEGSADTASFLIRRTGNVHPLTLSYTLSGTASSGVDYSTLSGSVTLPFAAASAVITVNAINDATREPTEAVQLTLVAGAGYTLGAEATAGVFITDAPGSGLRGDYYNLSSAAAPSPAPTGTPVLTRTDAGLSFSWTASPGAGVNADNFFVRWSGEVVAKSTGEWFFATETTNGARLSVNGTQIINNWSPTVVSEVASAAIDLVAGQSYPISLEYYALSGTARANLRWWSMTMPVETIPATHLYPTSLNTAGIQSDRIVYLLGSPPLNYTIKLRGTNGTLTAVNLPPGLTLNGSTGIISGTPERTGVWQTSIHGAASALLTFEVLQSAGNLTREQWDGVTATRLTQVDWLATPQATSTTNALQAPTNVAENFAARLRGWLTAPETGAYRFWISGSEKAAFFLANDDEPGTLIPRASVPSATAPLDWDDHSAQRSSLLWLEAGERYYFEARQLGGTGSDHLAVGWAKPGTSLTATAPAEIVPGLVLDPWTPPTNNAPTGGTLFLTSLSPQSGATTSGNGSSSLQLSADETYAVVKLNYGGLTSPVTGAHIHDASHGGLIIYDIDEAIFLPDGSMYWSIQPVGGLSAEEVLQVLKSGAAYVNVHSATYPAGEIKGFYKQTAASQQFTPPAAPPSWVDDHADAKAASRFLQQATYGSTWAEIQSVQSLGYEAWIDQQLAMSPSLFIPLFDEWYAQYPLGPSPTFTNPGLSVEFQHSDTHFFAWWRLSVQAPDQLKQRLAFALSQILVTSQQGFSFIRSFSPRVTGNNDMLGRYYEALLTTADFRSLLEQVTLNPHMGGFLNMMNNGKAVPRTGTVANENYARELLQLFSIGLNRMHPDGALILDSEGQPIANYDNAVISESARVLTGWAYFQPNQSNGLLPNAFPAGGNVPSLPTPDAPFINPMQLVPRQHDLGGKTILNRVYIPGLPSTVAQTDVANPTYQNLGTQELEELLDTIVNHPNVGPFLARQLIQRFVTSHPSLGYVYRVAEKFNDDGTGMRGNLHAMVKAVLLDYEARSPAMQAQQGYGKLVEPLLRVTHLARAFQPANPSDSSFFLHAIISSGRPSFDLYQEAFYAPSVFNFFLPDYQHAGPLAAAGLTTPEWQIESESGVILRANTLAAGAPFSQVRGGRAIIKYDFSALDAMTSVTELVDHLDTLLMAGRMSTEMRTILINHLSTLTAGSARRSAALQLITRSPDYLVLR